MPTVPSWWQTSQPSGARYHFLLAGIQESFARDMNLSKVRVECVFNDAAKLKLDFFESAKYVGGSPRLTRTLPMASAYYDTSHYFDAMDLEGYQPETPDSSHVSSDQYTGWPQIDGFAQYVLTFRNRPYSVLSDTAVDTLAAAKNDADPNSCVPEMFRWLRFTRRYLPESRKVPTAGFEVYDDGEGVGHPAFTPFVIQEVGSLPTFQIEIIAESIFWPAENFPDGGIQRCLGTVNQNALWLNGNRYPAGTLFYKGPGSALTPYKWVDGKFYYDIPHLFGFRPQGWNQHRLPAPIAADSNRQWYPIRVKGVADNVPQFQPEDHTLVFKPEPLH